jgi:hypothetical protein
LKQEKVGTEPLKRQMWKAVKLDVNTTYSAEQKDPPSCSSQDDHPFNLLWHNAIGLPDDCQAIPNWGTGKQSQPFLFKFYVP